MGYSLGESFRKKSSTAPNPDLNRIPFINTEHRYPILFLILSNVLLWSGIFVVDGILLQRDINSPLYNENYERYYLPMWNDFMSQPNIERLPRLVMSSPYLALVSLGMPATLVPKLAMVAAYTFASVSMYLFLSSLMKHLGSKRTLFYSIVGAFIFAYSPATLQFAGSITLVFSLGALPLLLYLILTRIRKRYFPLAASFLLLLSLGHPFVFIMNVFVAMPFTFMIFWRDTAARKMAIKKIIATLLIFPLFFAWFLLPYLSQPVSSLEFGRATNIDRDIFDLLSDNPVYDIITLERDQFRYIDTMSEDNFILLFHYSALSILVLSSFAIFFFKTGSHTQKIAIFASIGFLICTVFSLGSSGNLGESYWFLVSETTIGWMFRSPLKFQLYQSFFISILFVISLYLLPRKLGEKLRIKFASPFLAGTSKSNKKLLVPILAGYIIVGASFYGIYDANTRSLNPIDIPSEFYVINSMLENEGDGSKVIYYPVYSESRTDWSEEHVIAPFDSRSSRLSTYDLFLGRNEVKERIYDYPYRNDNLKSAEFYDFLASLGIKYIVFHNDRISGEGRGYSIDQKNLNYLLNSDHLALEYSNNDWYLFRIKSKITGPISAVSNIVQVDQRNDLYSLSSGSVGVIDRSSFKGDFQGKSLEKLSLLNGTIGTTMDNLLDDLSPDHWQDRTLPDGWIKENAQFSTTKNFDPESNNYYLEISTNQAKSNSWSRVISEPVEANEGEKYLFSLDIKTMNVLATHVKIEGYNAAENEWIDLVYLTPGMNKTAVSLVGDTDWSTYWKTYTIPTNVDNIRYVINSGGVLNSADGDAKSWIKNIGVFMLEEEIAPKKEIISYAKISPTAWKVNINATEPFVLTLSETYDNGWVASSNSYETKSIPLYGVINGFYIDKLGDYTINIEYKPQKYFELGAIISIISAVGLITYLYVKRNRSNDLPSEAMTPKISYTSSRHFYQDQTMLNSSLRRLDGISNYLFVIALILLFALPFLIVQNASGHATYAATFALYFLFAGVGVKAFLYKKRKSEVILR